MTLIVTHKGYLAVDSIRYGITRNSTGGKHRRVLDNNVNKLVIPEGEVFFQDQRVLAIARCGSLSLTKVVVEDILHQRDLLKRHGHRMDESRYKPHWRGRLVVLTEESAFEVKVHAKSHTSLWIKDLEDQPYAAGHGSKIALYLMKHLDVKAIDALNASMLDRTTEGNRVRYVNRKKDGTLTKPRIYRQDPNRTKLQVAQHLLSQVHSKM